MKNSFRDLKNVLKKVSRSFYLSLIMFPSSIKKQICLTYLFCKIADTIVDSDLYPKEEKRKILFNFYDLFVYPGKISDFMKSVPEKSGMENERQLLCSIGSGFDLFRSFSLNDRQSILKVLHRVILGMEMDLGLFDHPPFGKMEAFKNEQNLDQYCYYVAGSVGEFLTDLFFRYNLINKNREKMISLGIRMGHGLQLTNILRDRKEDFQRKRFYLSPDLSFILLKSTFLKTICFLEDGLNYILFLPKRAWTIRLACLWPVIFALKTLEKIGHESADYENKVKISRYEVYLTLAVTFCLLFSNIGISRYFNSIKTRIYKNSPSLQNR